MKRNHVVAAPLRAALSALLLGACALRVSPALGQATPYPPERMTYQGFLVGSDGVALGNTAPKNYDVIFRIWTDQTAGNALWAEQQTVTVDKGYFSVLLGEGASTGDPRPALSTLFKGADASDRFVAITVKGIGPGGGNVDIQPRLRLLSSPYAFLAQNAVKLVQNNAAGTDLITSSGSQVTVNGGVGIISNNAFELGVGIPGGKQADAGKIGYELYSSDALDIVGAGTTGANRKLKIWAEGGTTFTGPVTAPSITATSASLGALDLSSVHADGGRITHTQGTHLEWNKDGSSGMSYLLNQKGLGSGGIVLGEVNAANAITERVRITSSGLQLFAGNYYIDNSNTLNAKNSTGNYESFLWPRWSDNVMYMNYGSGGFNIRNNDSSPVMFMKNNGSVGIGTTDPSSTLDVNGSVGIYGANVLEFGKGVAKEGSAGKIGYGTFVGDALNIVGAGTTGSNRKVQIYAEGGLNVNGPLSASTLNVYTGYGLTFQVNDNTMRVYQYNNKAKYFQMYRYDQGVAIQGFGGGWGNASGDSRIITWDGDGNWDSSSDRKLKKDIVDAEPVLERALQVQVRRFRWKDDPADAKLALGVIAQELQPLFPDLIATQENPVTKESNLAVGYSDFGLIAIKAIQEFKAQHDSEMAALKSQMAELIQQNKALQNRLSNGTVTASTAK